MIAHEKKLVLMQYLMRHLKFLPESVERTPGQATSPHCQQVAVAKLDFNSMHRLKEKHGYYNDQGTAEGKASRVVRERRVAGKSEVFTEEQIELFRKLSRKAAAKYGYGLS